MRSTSCASASSSSLQRGALRFLPVILRDGDSNAAALILGSAAEADDGGDGISLNLSLCPRRDCLLATLSEGDIGNKVCNCGLRDRWCACRCIYYVRDGLILSRISVVTSRK